MGEQVCQLCGNIGIYTGHIHAMQTHPRILGRYEFICCGSGEKAAVTLAAQSFRFCELCHSRVPAAEKHRYEGRIWCCPDCAGRIERDGYFPAFAESRGRDPSAARACVQWGRGEWHFGLVDNALDYYRKAILIYRRVAEADPRRWRSELVGIQREREAIALWLLNRPPQQAEFGATP